MCNFLLAKRREEEKPPLSPFGGATPFLSTVYPLWSTHARPSYEIVLLGVSRFKAESMFVSSSVEGTPLVVVLFLQFIIWPRETFLAGDPRGRETNKRE